MKNREQSSLVYPHVQQAGPAAKVLARGLSCLFRGVGSLRNFAYDQDMIAARKLPGKVISVGNIAVGGTGKTPTVIAMLGFLLARGCKPAVLTRGYGSGLKKGDWVLLKAGERAGGNSDTKQLPDEARLQSATFPSVPVIAGPARYAAAAEFLRQCSEDERPTHWILDDGFQHRAINRDFDLVLLDRGNPFGNFSVLPFGMLREPPQALARADHILLTGTTGESSELREHLQKYAPEVPVSHAELLSVPLARDIADAVSFDPQQHTPALMVAGIAHPVRLRRDLENESVVVGNELIPGDHAQFSASDLEKSAKGMRSAVITAKDYWRNPDVFRALKIPVFIKNIEIRLPESLLTKLV